MIISFVGDISLQGLDQDKIVLDQNIRNVFNNSCFVIGNLENPITDSNIRTDKTFIQLKTIGSSVKLLKYFNALSLCNNHMFDYGIRGFTDTVNFLTNNNISYFGAGINTNLAQKPLKIQINEKHKIALISGTRWANATKYDSGTAPYRGYKNIIRNLKAEGYFIVYYPHWGYEYIQTPPPDVRKHAHKMIDYGVDIIIGTHPHVLQGFEVYKNKHIFFSLGNFIFKNSIIENTASPNNYKKCKTTILLQIIINDDYMYNFKIYPISFKDDKISILDSEESKVISNYFFNISDIFSKPYHKYLKEYYYQVPQLFDNERRISKIYPIRKKLNYIEKLKNITKQGILNRLAYIIIKKTKKGKCI